MDLEGADVRGNRASQSGGGARLVSSTLVLHNHASIAANEAKP